MGADSWHIHQEQKNVCLEMQILSEQLPDQLAYVRPQAERAFVRMASSKRRSIRDQALV